MNLDLDLITYRKIKKPFIDLNVKNKIISLLEENKGENLCGQD